MKARYYLTIFSAFSSLTLSSPAPSAGVVTDLPDRPWFPKAPPLPLPMGEVIRVSSVEQLYVAAGQVKPGGTILIADGHYMMPRYFELDTDNVTLRGASGNREKVILDGAQSVHGELVGISRCSGVTIADLTIQNIKWNGFKINSDTNVQRVTIYNCVIHNIWQRGVKGVKVPEEDRENVRPKDCKIQYCLFYNDRAKQFSDDPADTVANFNGNYIGGIDTMYAKNWIISDNVFVGIQGRTREGRGCIFMWHHAENCIIERNIIINCDIGIALGNSSGIGEGMSSVHCTNFVVRNNFVSNTPETGILADYTKDCKIVNNTVHDPDNVLRRLIRVVHDNDGLLVANNFLSGPKMRVETPGEMVIKNNVEKVCTLSFADPENGDLHLKENVSEVIDKALPLPEVYDDIDGRPRGPRPDIGADEFEVPSAAHFE